MTEQPPSKELGGSLTVAAGWPSDASITLHPDGRITFGEGLKPDVAAQVFLDTLQQLWATQAAPEPPAEWLESKEFYEVMQAYRHAHLVDQAFVCERFEAVKAFIRRALPPPAEQACKPLLHLFTAPGEPCVCGAVPWGQPSNTPTAGDAA